jgi:GNAT superfamily N-acetyltransferase
MIIRPPTADDVGFCCDLAAENWDFATADRCHLQLIESFKKGPYSPVFGIADIGPGPIGFAAFAPSMLMKGAFDQIWLLVHPQYRGSGAGKALINWRLDEIKKRGGQMVLLMTQKPDYFSKFGFFKLHHTGNEWYLMLKLLTAVNI